MDTPGQWLKRARRAGHAFGELAHIRRGKPENIWAPKARRALGWTTFLMGAVLGGLMLDPLIFLALLVFPAQIARIALRDRPVNSDSWIYGALLMAQKPWEAAGVMQYWLGRISGKRNALIEYK